MMLKFGNINNSELIIKNTWCEFRNALKNKVFLFSETEKAKELTFLKVFNDLFFNNNGMEYLTVPLKSIKNNLMRGTKLDANEVVNHERFLPKKEFIKSSNRFSPPGVEWLYLALETSTPAVETIKKEIRIESNQRFGYCNFKLNDEFAESKIIDLTISNDYTYECFNLELNRDLTNSANEIIKREKQKGKVPIKGQKFFGSNERNMIKRWAVFTYCKLLSEQIFIPIETVDTELEYAPFQTIAQYFISLGYSGIIYKSTVSKGGKNMVLFDKAMAAPFGIIKEEIIQ